MLDLYISERVKELTGGKQTPTTTKTQAIQNFPIAMKNSEPRLYPSFKGTR